MAHDHSWRILMELPDEIYVTSKSIQQQFSISGITIRRIVERGILHPVRIGRIIRYPLSEVKFAFRGGCSDSSPADVGGQRG
jgi:hypothetical protein